MKDRIVISPTSRQEGHAELVMEVDDEGIVTKGRYLSITPVRWAALIGCGVSVIGFVYMLYIIIKTIVTGIDVPGYASLMVVILFLGGIQLIFLGIIGEYLGRTFNESKHRPLYFIERYNETKETNEHLNK